MRVRNRRANAKFYDDAFQTTVISVCSSALTGILIARTTQFGCFLWVLDFQRSPRRESWSKTLAAHKQSAMILQRYMNRQQALLSERLTALYLDVVLGGSIIYTTRVCEAECAFTFATDTERSRSVTLLASNSSLFCPCQVLPVSSCHSSSAPPLFVCVEPHILPIF